MKGFKPELLATAGTVGEAVRLMEAGADALTLGNSRYGMRLPGDFALSDIAESVRMAKANGIRIYVAVNQIMNNEILPELPDYLRSLEQAGVDAILFGDPAVLVAAKHAAPSLNLHWNAEMTATNYVTANYWAGKGAVRAVLARELNMEQVLAFKSETPMEVQVQVHGMTNIYHSKRQLVSSYREHQREQRGGATAVGGERITEADGSLFLIEAERPDERYPIFEDGSGTHIMSADDICMIENLPELIDGRIDSLKIEGMLKSEDYQATAVRCYREAIDAYCADPAGYSFNPEWQERIEQLQDPRRELSFGFFYKEQVY